ncbi:MAG: head-tail connector protein [Proteobacteria bacterium]|nr:head-tail connector protein [Pseudomonadota bacterium]
MNPAELKKQRDALWGEKRGWNALYQDAYRYAIPYRRSVGNVSAKTLTAEIFDITAPIGAQRFAGQLHQDMFPPGQPFFTLAPGAVAEKAMKRRGEDKDALEWKRHLESMSDEMHPHFMTGAFDSAIAEMCVDLSVGTGVMLTLEATPGISPDYLNFATLPFEEMALAPGPNGTAGGLFWKSMHAPSVIKAQWPHGRFSDEFNKKLADSPYDPVEINQDFIWRDGRWHMVCSLGDEEAPFWRETFRTKPFIAPRYFKVPGETYGRGPLLMSLGAIRTLNRVVELQLKSAALQMLGIWGYRPGGTVNPDVLPLVPGAFWPMEVTGGVLGPDVFRVDTGGKEIQIGSIVMEDLRTQIRAALHDDTIPDSGATPKSATEIMARAARIKTNYLGAFGRLLHETVPGIVPRAYEVLRKAGVMRSPIEIDQFLTRVSVTSPLAQTLRAEALKSVFEYVQVVGMVKGPQAVDRHMKLDELLEQVGLDMGVAAKFLKTEAERRAYDEQAAAQAAQATLTEAAASDPKGMAEAATMMDEASGRPNLKLVS